MRIPDVLVCLSALFLLGPDALHGQAPTKLEFEVASVRASGPLPPGARGGRRGLVTSTPERLTYQRASLRRLLMDAYGVQRDQITGPAWALADAVDGGALFDISANVPPGATKEQVAMLQNLLKERFHLSLPHAWAKTQGHPGDRSRGEDADRELTLLTDKETEVGPYLFVVLR